MPEEVIPITNLSAEIRRFTGQDGPGYRRLHYLACDGKLPAHQMRGRWLIRRSDLPAVAEMLGLTALTTPADRAAA